MVPDTGDFIAVISDMTNPSLLQSFAQASISRPLRSVILPVFDGGWPIPQTRRSDHASLGPKYRSRYGDRYSEFQESALPSPSRHTRHLSPEFLAASTEYVWRALIPLVGVAPTP